ncbi:glycosyltransferase family 4 protein [Gillisia hiemivivida]|uniref:Glycosyltransferase family 4 protein n=1 Tax=Gillisia hiemivivida TaxID=291190 RepID=A0A5C7A4H3_9FLAO|nr:glycosyltransferase family 4 protein [Gillisia hiemivivida]TXD95739.1 glycosyltransferase family 4 protein [Gillisia hiemivivida]
MDYKQYLKYLLIQSTYFVPFLSKKTIFVSILNKNNITGPGRFLYNLEKGLLKYKLFLERRLLSKCGSVLIISSAPPSFLNFCKKRKIRTVLRVDGFSLPFLYDNKDHVNREKRIFTPQRIKTNQEMQIGLLKSDFVIYQSYFSKTIADEYLFTRVNEYSIINNGVDTNFFKPVPKKNPGELILGIYGTLRDIDIVRTGLEAFLLYQSKNPETKIHLIGTMTREVECFVDNWVNKNQGIFGKVIITGTVHLERLPSILGELDISLHLTFGDACPNAVLENLSCSNPVICVEWGGASELICDAGISIDQPKYAYDYELVEKVAEGIKIIRENLEHYSNKARDLAVNKYSLEIMVEKYKNVLEKL